MRQLAEVTNSGISPRWLYEGHKRLVGKTIHVIGPCRLENELLAIFIGRETGADCRVTDFDMIEKHLDKFDQEPMQLFLIDYHETRLQELLKQAFVNRNGSSLVRRLVSLLNPEKGKEAAEQTCGIFYQCDSTVTLLNRIYRLFNSTDFQRSADVESMRIAHETTPVCTLTWRELQLLMLMSDGLRNREIAGRIGISYHTVRTHLYNSFGKIGARNRLEALSWIESHISFVFLLI
jgi:LuxR family transcriptional regulator of csgAB operon